MVVAYITSRFSVSFVTNEMEAHRLAHWDVLPIASCRRPSNEKLSELQAQWVERGLFRPTILTQAFALIKEFITHPIRFTTMILWLTKLFAHSKSEFAKAVYELSVVSYFASHCRRNGVEHLHVHFASRSLSLGLMLGILLDRKVSCTVHAFDIFTRSSGSLTWRLSQCCFISSISNYNIEFLREHCGDKVADLCRVVHCGIDPDKFSIINRNLKPGRFLIIANLVTKKGHEIILRACHVLDKQKIDFIFNVVGDGPLRPRIEYLIAVFGLQNKVKLCGAIPNDKLLPLLSEACALVLPSTIDPSCDRDGIPVAMMEAMACELPVISTWVSGIPELVCNEVTGLLVHERDSVGLANAMKRLMNDPAKVSHMGKAGREYVLKHFNINSTSAQLRELIVQAKA